MTAPTPAKWCHLNGQHGQHEWGRPDALYSCSGLPGSEDYEEPPEDEEPRPCNRDVGRSGICALEHGHPPPCYAKSALARDLLPTTPARPCQFCGSMVRRGHSVNGRLSVFDMDPPHVNHWITCQKRELARKAYPRR